MWVTANRLDRLHVRTEAAWVALEGALSRRVAATRTAVAAGAFPPRTSASLRRLTALADRADRGHRADAENDLTRALAELPPLASTELATELADAGERVALARRFYNDAVRDTRALRTARFTRWFRLAGRAALPDYFEIADPATAPPVHRVAARVVLFDDTDRVLLFTTNDSGRSVWFPPGGGVEGNETLAETALRELHEETGLVLPKIALAGPVWARTARFPFAGTIYEQDEVYFAARVDHAFEPDTTGFTEMERKLIAGGRWWTRADLATPGDTVYPLGLAARLGEAWAAASDPGREVVMTRID